MADTRAQKSVPSALVSAHGRVLTDPHMVQAQAELDAARVSVARSLDTLRGDFQDLRLRFDTWRDWRRPIRRHPYAVVGGALLFGFAWSFFRGRRRAEPEREQPRR